MLSSAFFFFAAKVIFFLRALAPLLQQRDRQAQKTKLLSSLLSLKRMKFGELATKAIGLADKTFNTVGGSKILSIPYVVRCAVIGLGLGVLLSAFASVLIVNDFAQAVRVVQKPYWWQFIFLPSVLTATFLAPVDIVCAHLLVRWGKEGRTTRAYIALIAALPLAYALWAVGAGFAAIVGFLVSSNLFIPSFVWNRIVVAFFNPIQSSGSIQIGAHWFSYGLLAASSALSSFLVSAMFFAAALLRTFPAPLQRIVAAPIFWALDALNWLDRKKINVPIQVLSWAVAFLLIVCAVIFRLIGF